nr:F-box protein At1g10110-like isoform X2 [Lolium perenne]
MGGTPPVVDSTPGDELSGAAMAPSGWSDLPNDLLLSILQRLELPQALAFEAVCTAWFSAAKAAGIPHSRTPWLVSWANFLEQREFKVDSRMNWAPGAATCNFRHPLDVHKVYNVNFPKGCFVACCGASHGWLVLVNDLSNLVLFNTFTSCMIPLPPITDFACVTAVYDKGNLQHYLFRRDQVYQTNYLGTWFYQKAVLSCSPSNGGDYIAMIIHCDSDWLSFIKAGESKWQTASILNASKEDRYIDCAYHNGRFYSVTMHGTVIKWDLDAPDGPTKEVIVKYYSHYAHILTRHLVSTPWGDLWQVRMIYTRAKSRYPDNVKFKIRKVDIEGCRKVSMEELRDHAIFVGLNHSACLPTENLRGVQPQLIYFSAPWMTQAFDLLGRISDWGGVRAYDPKTRTFKRVFPFGGMRDSLSILYPSEVWITPDM